MKLAAPVAFVTLAIAAVACTKTPATPPRVPMPADVVAIIQMPSIDGAVSAVMDYADQVDPESAAEIRDALSDEDAKNLREGFDWTRPAYVIFVVPPAGTEDPELALVAAVKDIAALEKMKAEEKKDDFSVHVEKQWAVVGDPGAVSKAEAWAFSSLATAAAPTKLSATIFAPAFRKRWSADLRSMLDLGDSDGEVFLRDAIMGLVEQTDRVDVTVEVADSVLSVDVALTARAKTSLASMLAAQKPASFALLEQLPLDQPFGTMAAHLSLGAYGAPIRNLITTTLTSALGPFGPRSASLFETLWSLGTGEYAGVTIGASGMVVNAINVSDPAKAYGEIDEMAASLSAVAMTSGLRFDITHPKHDGVELGLGKLDAGDASIAVGWAAWDKILAISMSDPDGAVLRSTIDRSRGKPNPIPSMAKVIADARARGDSFLLTVDVLAGKHAPLVVTFGVREGVGHLWTHVPAAQVTAIAGMPAFD